MSDFTDRARMALHDMQGRIEGGKLAMFERTIEYAEVLIADFNDCNEERRRWKRRAEAAEAKVAKARKVLTTYALDYDYEAGCSVWDGGQLARKAIAEIDAPAPEVHPDDLGDKAWMESIDPAPEVTVAKAAKVILNNSKAIDGAFDACDPTIEKMAMDYAGNRMDAVGQLEIAEDFFRAALRALAGEKGDE